jgi:NAD(P)-dependent dehydrogenase (short-subunit alcohol dehydrogenase family)
MNTILKLFFCLIVEVALLFNNVALASSSSSKVVVITGASRGIGLITAQYLASQGYIVYGTVRSTSNPSKLDTAVERHKGNLFKVVMSLTNEQEIQKVMNSIIKDQGKIDVLINNAGYALVGTVESSTLQEQKDLFDINYFGPVRTIQAVLPQMRKNKQGMIINITTVSAISPFSPLENYSASKFALRGLSESMAASLSPWNIKTVIIEPATIRTMETTPDAVGSRDLGTPDPYNSIRNYVEDSCEGQDPLDLAKLIEEIIETPNPHVRYQIGEFAHDIAARVYVDSTGDDMKKSNIEYYRSVGLIPNE